MTHCKVLFASPVQQKPHILQHFLAGLQRQTSRVAQVDFLFVDDNHDPASKELLSSFSSVLGETTVVPVKPAERYHKDDHTHHWNESLIWRVAAIKDAIIEVALAGDYDFLFLSDSDLVLRAGTIDHLIGLQEMIVSEVFWTKWTPQEPLMPQVWLADHYELAYRERFEALDAREKSIRERAFLDMLTVPGTYDVGGLGACTLIKREALERGARFAEIPNVSFWGEDRHFCIRAMALGLRLRADTHLAPLHLYRDADVDRVNDFIRLDERRRELSHAR